MLQAVEAILRSIGSLPVNVKFMLEGEEEVGSPFLGESSASLLPFETVGTELLLDPNNSLTLGNLLAYFPVRQLKPELIKERGMKTQAPRFIKVTWLKCRTNSNVSQRPLMTELASHLCLHVVVEYL